MTEMRTELVPARIAREMLLNAQRLDGRCDDTGGKTRTFEIIEALGYIQIDTIYVVERAHHHTLWTRQKDYSQEMLHQLQKQDRLIFEYWTHAMSYVPMCDYRFYLPRMRHFMNPSSPWSRMMLDKAEGLLEPVLDRIRQEGPLGSDDFKKIGEQKGGTWWDWKPAKIALELLFWRGELMVKERLRFKKLYDLTERVLPETIDTSMPGDEELGQFHVHRALRALALASKKDILRFLQPEASRDADLQIVGKDAINRSLQDLIEEDEVVALSVEGDEKTIYYSRKEPFQQAEKKEHSYLSVSFLSPFDNMIIQRERTNRLFRFEYTLECYVPAPKRKYGYFVHPILWGDQFVGRIDPKADRKQKRFIVNQLLFESGFQISDHFLCSLADKLVSFARFNCCEEVVLQEHVLTKTRRSLGPLLKKAFLRSST